jgi:aldehyde:ferredoxin oxidoreductase
VRNPEAAVTPEPYKNVPTLSLYVDYMNGTTGSHKTLQDILDDSERLYVLQKLINLRQGKGTRASDQVPLRAVAPVYLDEYQSREEHYNSWLKDHLDGAAMPATAEERHRLVVQKRLAMYQQLCDLVYEKKGFTSGAVPKRETVEKLGLLDDQAERLLREFGI